MEVALWCSVEFYLLWCGGCGNVTGILGEELFDVFLRSVILLFWYSSILYFMHIFIFLLGGTEDIKRNGLCFVVNSGRFVVSTDHYSAFLFFTD